MSGQTRARFDTTTALAWRCTRKHEFSPEDVLPKPDSAKTTLITSNDNNDKHMQPEELSGIDYSMKIRIALAARQSTK